MTHYSWITQPKPGGTLNEDRFGSAPGFAWLLDGATSKDGPAMAHDAHWLVNAFSQMLAAASPEDVPLNELAAWLCCELGAQWMAPGPRPLAAMALWRVHEGVLEAVLSGNVSLFVRAEGKTLEFTDDRELRGHAGKDQLILDACARGVQFEDAEFQALRRQMKQAESIALQEDAGWLITPAPRKATDFITVTPPFSAQATLVAMTDGFLELRSYLHVSSEAFLDLVLSQPLHVLLDQLRSFERADNSGQLLPITKRHDDATVVIRRGDC